jgi:5-methylcytosine-specific restriction endonuclease McrA
MICNYCACEFEPKHFNQRLCSPECKHAAILRANANYKKTDKGIKSNAHWIATDRRKENERRYVRKPERRKKLIEAQKRYNQTPLGRMRKRIYDEHRRCSKIGKFTQKEWQAKLTEFGGKCAHCGSSDHLTIDHIVPISLGGLNVIDNLQPLCGRCNSSKGARYVG